jgi:hypothetical protein
MADDETPERSDRSRPFTSSDLQRQRDIAIDLLVFQIEQSTVSSAPKGSTPLALDAWQLPARLESIRERDPNALVVLEAVTERLVERERGWGLLH